MRILVQGASTVIWVGTRHNVPGDGPALTRALEAELCAAGQPATVSAAATPARPIKYSLRDWDHETLAYGPDVVVSHYGQADVLHLFVPWWLTRHVQQHNSLPGRFRELYRGLLLPAAWRVLMRVQRWVETRTSPRISARRIRRLGRQIDVLIRRSTDRFDLLYLQLDIPVPSPHYQRWFPGLAERMQMMNDVLRDVIERIDRPNVRLVPVTEIIAQYEAALGKAGAATPDGAHYSAAAHALIAERLAAEILKWQAERQASVG